MNPSDTLIATRRGNIPIKDITINDYVLTPFGFYKVLKSCQTGYSICIKRQNLIATKKHRIFTFNLDFVTMDTLTDVDKLCKIDLCDMMKATLLRLLNLTECSINEWVENEDITCLNPKVTKGGGILKACMLQFGSFIIKKQYKKATKFIIKMVIHLTIVLKTWSYYQGRSMLKSLKTLIKKKCVNIWRKLDILQVLGIKAQRGENGIQSTHNPLNAKEIKKETVIFAEQNILLKCSKPKGIAQINVAVKQDGQEVVIQRKKIKVYNLQIDKIPLFYANGVLVHNCDSLTDACYIASTLKEAQSSFAGSWVV